jgi:ParB/RepB/Spo0J family partition protein
MNTLKIQELTKQDLGNTTTVRENSTRTNDETVKISLDKIVIRDTWNVRHDMGDIRGLADSILANGQSVAGRVDVLADGTFLLVDGHRRYAACKLLEKDGNEVFFKAIVNGSRTTEEQRILQMFTTQDNKQLLPNEVAELILRLINLGHDVPSVAKKIGKSTVYVSDMLEFAEEVPAIKNHVKNGYLTVSAANKIRKAIPNTTERIAKTNAAVAAKKDGKNKITASDVTGKQVNSFAELKKFLNTMDGSDLTDCKAEIHNFACAIVNNEMDAEQIKEYFSK